MNRHKTSIIILSYNTYTFTKNCIESIRKFTVAGSYEIIVVDNASEDASVAWLKEQGDIKLICNIGNKGFPAGCNQGIAMAGQGNDILLLNSDTIVTPNWLENLQTALYSAENIGAVSCVTNCCSNFQQIETKYGNHDEMLVFAEKFNHSNPSLWEERSRLVMFCYLVKNAAYKSVGLLDERFSPGNFEDDDYSFRLIFAGYKLVLCRDTFIHHYGSVSFFKLASPEERKMKHKMYVENIERNRKKFIDKWQVSNEYGDDGHSVVSDIAEPRETKSRILLVGCNIVGDIYYLQKKYPSASIYGVIENWVEAAVEGKCLDVKYCPDTENYIFALLKGKYDYILLANKNKVYRDFEGYIKKLMPYLTNDGSIHIDD